MNTLLHNTGKLKQKDRKNPLNVSWNENNVYQRGFEP